jgi:flavodoxin
MKFRSILVLFIVLTFTQCALAEKDKKVLVVYYSRDGHTQKAALMLAEKFGADTERLVDKKKRTGPVGNSSAGMDALADRLTVIEKLKKKPDDYDVVLIGTPSWFSNPTPAVRTFVKQYNLKGKRIGVFGTAHLTGVESCLQELAELISKDGAGQIPKLALTHKDLEDGSLRNKVDMFYKEIMEQ